MSVGIVRCALLEDSIVSHKCGEKFYGEYDSSIHCDDPDMGIDCYMNASEAREGHQFR